MAKPNNLTLSSRIPGNLGNTDKRAASLRFQNPSNIRWETGNSGKEELNQWHVSPRKSSGYRAAGGAATALWSLLTAASPALAQGSGLSFESAKESISPILNAITLPFYLIGFCWQYAMERTAAATLAAAVLASSVAIVSIRKQREIARLKETFTTLDKNNWDQDLIEARVAFGKLKNEIKEGGKGLSEYSHPKNEDEIKQATALYSILNDYENMSIAIRMDILDEVYLYRYMRGLVIEDWGDLSPLVTAARHARSLPLLYIEFEGLAESWQLHRSYRTNKPLNKVHRKISIR
jgi:hypothetical protein